MEKVRIVMNKGDEDLIPVKAHPDDAGFDIHANAEMVVKEIGRASCRERV